MSTEFALRWRNPPRDVQWIFFQAASVEDFGTSLRGIAKHLIKPLQGGLVEGRVILNLPTGETLYGLSFRGTLEKWKNGVICYCQETDRLTASVQGGKLTVSNGAEYDLQDLRAEDY